MVRMKDKKYLAYSPDGLAVLYKNYFEDCTVHLGRFEMEGEYLLLAAIEVKNRVAATSLGSSDTISAKDAMLCIGADATLKKYVPREYT